MQTKHSEQEEAEKRKQKGKIRNIHNMRMTNILTSVFENGESC